MGYHRSMLAGKRVILRRFKDSDIKALYELLSDEKVNTYLPWYPLKTIEEARSFYEERLKDRKYAFAICLKDQDYPIGYVCISEDDSHDMGYAIALKYQRQGLVFEACAEVIAYLKKEGVAYITATHDEKNEASGKVMRKLGMRYLYSYKERWMPKDIDVFFRLYELDIDMIERTYIGYWLMYQEHYI